MHDIKNQCELVCHSKLFDYNEWYTRRAEHTQSLLGITSSLDFQLARLKYQLESLESDMRDEPPFQLLVANQIDINVITQTLLECKPDFAERVFEIETGLIERWAARYKLKKRYKMQISKVVQLAENQLRQYDDVSSTFK